MGGLQPLARRQFLQHDRRPVADRLAAGQPAQPDQMHDEAMRSVQKLADARLIDEIQKAKTADRRGPGRRGAGPPPAREAQRRGGQRRVSTT